MSSSITAILLGTSMVRSDKHPRINQLTAALMSMEAEVELARHKLERAAQELHGALQEKEDSKDVR